MNDTDVLVVGAGPVGLFLAVLLRRAGRTVRVLEARAAQSEHSKAVAVMPRTLEAFRIAGIGAPFEAAAHRLSGLTLYIANREISNVAIDLAATRYDYVATIAQNVTERLLYDALIAAGGAVEYGTTVTGLVDAAEGVRLRVERAGSESTMLARYAVGCDGPHSAVRDALGLGFTGGTYDDTFVLFDVDTVGDVPADRAVACLHDAGLLAIFPLSSKRRRLIATVAPDDSAAPTLDDANALIAERGPWNIGATKLHWSSRFRIHHRQVASMQKTSAFLAGDAAHVHSPFGGQGMNTGLADAFNLAWKLDFELAGFATDGLLPSYSSERHRIARDVIRATDAGTRIATARNPVVRALRDWLLPSLAENRRVQHGVIARFSGLQAGYAHSPIVAGTGARAPDDVVRSGGRERTLYDVLGGRYLLVYPASVSLGVIEALDTFVSHYGGAVRTASAEGAGLPFVRLVRPDGYLALETPIAEDPTPALERLAQTLATHVRRVGRMV